MSAFWSSFFSEIMLECWGCGLYTSAAYTRVFTVILKKLICKKLTILCSHSNFNSLTHPGTSRAQACCRSVHLVKLKLLQRNCFRRIVLDLCAGISIKLFINACINVRPEGGDPGQMWGIWLFRRSFGQNPHYGAPEFGQIRSNIPWCSINLYWKW